MKIGYLALILGLTLPITSGQSSCSDPDQDGDGYTVTDGDCDDSDPAVYPGALEACDARDNDCDAMIDELATCYAGAPPTAMLSSGPVEGMADDENTFAFLGIPYAAPPTGARRWAPPIDPKPWTGVLEATSFGPACPQFTTADTDGDGQTETVYSGNEDCLQLNVWRPMTASTPPRPVMVWIHGGGNIGGASSLEAYRGARMAALGDVVVVSIQYRLSFLGWLRHEALQTGDPLSDSGNYGLLDLVKALKWVQANAGAFGGDSDNVTIFGESAGGHNTWALMLSPLSEGLFHRAIVQSGYQTFATPDSARAISQKLLEKLVVVDGLATADTAAAYLEAQGTAWIHDYLYGKSAEQIMPVFAAMGAGLTDYTHIQDGLTMPLDAQQNLARGDYHRVPLMVGSNRDESKTFLASLWNMSEAQYRLLMNVTYGGQVDEIEALYPRNAYDPATAYNQYCDIQDNTFELLYAAYFGWLVSPYQDTYLYHFRYDNLVAPLDYQFGAGHSLEAYFVFGTLVDELYAQGTEAERLALSNQMIEYWTCFARTGAPSGCGDGPTWPRLTRSGTGANQRMVLDDLVTPDTLPALDIQRMNYWLDYYGLELPAMPAP